MLSNAERAQRWAKGEGYNRYITSELQSFRKRAWKETLCGHFLPDETLDILDVGTGPGFFACILSEEGHRVTGIDSSEGMLSCARDNASKLAVRPIFRNMDANFLDFPDSSFDVIVTRNVTWTLARPEEVYTEFKRVLRPGGKLLIYDANWHMHYFDEELMCRVRAREQRHFEKYGRREVVCGDDMEYYISLPLSARPRPQWDRTVLERLGFRVSIREDVGQRVYEEWEKALYGESPLFEVCAVKGELCEDRSRVHQYWQKRASTFGGLPDAEAAAPWQERLRKYLPESRLKVLDAGTGCGFMASVLAMMGHEVTGIDLCSNMITRAKENAREKGLEINFLCTDAGELPFADDNFDLIVSRNVVWALTNPEEVLSQWRRVLKPGGLLLYFDGNHYYYHFNKEALAYRQAYHALAGSLHRNDPGTVDYSEMDNAARGLPLSRCNRPHEWDEPTLPALGYEIIAIEEEHPQELLKDGIAEGYYTSFLVAARKCQMEEG